MTRSERFYERLADIDRVSLVGKITLPNGRAGIISGHNRDFAVFTDNETGLECEYA